LQETDEMKLSAYIKTILNFEYEIGIKMNKRLDQRGDSRIKYTIQWAKPVNYQSFNRRMIDMIKTHHEKH